MADKTTYKPSVGQQDYPVKVNAFVDAVADGLDPFGRAGSIQNLSLAFSVAGNALTCNIKARDGSAPSANSPVAVAMRNSALATGDFTARQITAALALTINSGATMGHLGNVAASLYWYLIDNAGALELAVSSSFFGWSGIVSTTLMDANADSDVVMYSAAARVNLPFRCIGRTLDTQAVAGTWTAVPSSCELTPFHYRGDAIVRAANVALGVSDDDRTVIATGTFTQTFAAAATLGVRWAVHYRNDGAGVITLDPNGAETIDGAAAQQLGPGEACTIVCDGSALKTIGRKNGEFRSLQVFTSTGTYTRPAGLKRALVELVGGGAGGGGANALAAQAAVGAGGGGGGYAIELLESSAIGATETVTIGAAGSGGSGNSIGAAGGTTSFGALLSATGGSGGGVTGSGTGPALTDGASGGVGVGATVNINGGPGGTALILGGAAASGGKGGDCRWGYGGLATGADQNGLAGSGRGAGGGGACNYNATGSKTGGAGTAGVCIVWEYF